MEYVSIEELKDLGYIYDYDEFTVAKLLRLAQLKIDELTFGRINGIGFDSLTEFQKELVKKAVCEQVDYYANNGVDNSSVQSYSLAGVSVTMCGEKEHNRMDVSETVFNYLKMSGLMSRRI